ncbi:MAG: biopolymer transporter ExbD [Gammaproteobacteria bacterium]|nr:biopolymer transporter ExbD [Gammaproteobacteria bacterium]MCW8927211.1 biopolymer transporter ExbD [Gammaproteobacteria bacterium]MCW8973064.1 biopolymer transporter ExbD [Gammaproteobacteria bacterium]MCW8993518.1 biopolymer transporter ExbD [Gammaproteobacteria bacterium]MCW9089050.1 biopolymer transporter ExbD [Gammaproteobacteria bacterium]
MQFEGRRRTGHTPNLTPLIDIVFLLLVFFMLTSHFVQEQALNIDLPVADSGEAVLEDDQLEVVINAEGRLLIDEHIVEADNLEAVLQRQLEGRSEKTVRVRGDRGAPLGKAVTVLDAARKAGADSVDIVTEQR